MEESLPFDAQKKVENPEREIDSVLARQLDEELKELEEALALADREREKSKVFEPFTGLRSFELEQPLSIGDRRKVETPEKNEDGVQEWHPAEELEEALSLAIRSGLTAEKVRKFLHVAAWSNLMDYDVHSLAIRSGLKDEDALSLANNFIRMYKIVFTTLRAQLLASFDKRRFDRELYEWMHPHRIIGERRKHADRPFILFKMKASAKNAKVMWWQKKYSRFPPERSGYTGAVRVARLVLSRDGFHLEEEGEDGQPGALSVRYDDRYMGFPPRKVGVLKDGWLNPLDEVAVIKRLPNGDGISIMSYVGGLGLKLGDFLFVLHRKSCTVALSFIERSFYVSTMFKEEMLYAVPGIYFLDITNTVQNLIKKLYRVYEQEEQDKKIMQQKQDYQELMREQEALRPRLEEQQRKKLEDIRRRRVESKKQKQRRGEIREGVHRMKEVAITEKEYEEDCFCTPMLFCLEESDFDPAIGRTFVAK